MADTFTSKLGLRQYDATLNYDVSKFSADNLKIDNAFGTVICTSTTRPSTGLFNGMQLWETDTQRFVVRVSGAWVPVPNVVTIANAAARTAIVTPYDGMVIYRQDMDWLETYDGAFWRVPNGVQTSALANITNPVTGQYAVLTTDWVEYRWDGSSWASVRLVLPHPRIERRLNASTATGGSTDFKIPFDTNVTTGLDITYSAGDFTFARAGRYQFTTSIRKSANSEFYLWFGKSSSSSGNRGKDSIPTGGGLNKATAATVRVAAGEAWSVYCWSNPTVNLVRENSTTDDYAPYFAATYMGPL